MCLQWVLKWELNYTFDLDGSVRSKTSPSKERKSQQKLKKWSLLHSCL